MSAAISHSASSLSDKGGHLDGDIGSLRLSQRPRPSLGTDMQAGDVGLPLMELFFFDVLFGEVLRLIRHFNGKVSAELHGKMPPFFGKSPAAFSICGKKRLILKKRSCIFKWIVLR